MSCKLSKKYGDRALLTTIYQEIITIIFFQPFVAKSIRAADQVSPEAANAGVLDLAAQLEHQEGQHRDNCRTLEGVPKRST